MFLFRREKRDRTAWNNLEQKAMKACDSNGFSVFTSGTETERKSPPTIPPLGGGNGGGDSDDRPTLGVR